MGRTWDGREITKKAEVAVRKGPENNVILEVRAPFYNDPAAPKGPSGEPFPQLWDYEGKLLYVSFNKGRAILMMKKQVKASCLPLIVLSEHKIILLPSLQGFEYCGKDMYILLISQSKFKIQPLIQGLD